MFLFLDVVSPIPEFHLFDYKKVIDSVKITNNLNDKLSDLLIPKYLEINNTYELSKNLKKLIITIGPGSYTSLRVGASFIAGLSQSMSLPVSVISNFSIYMHLQNSYKEIGIYIESSKNQKFFSYKKNSKLIHEKIDNKGYLMPKSVDYLFYNCGLPYFMNTKIKSETFSIKLNVIENLHKLEFKKKLIIKPIYISNNTILN